MSYPLSDEARLWQQKARDFAGQELMPHEVAAELDQGRLPPAVERRHRERALALGFSRMDVPLAHGGLALPMLVQAVVWEQLGKVTNGLAWCFSEPQRWLFEACSPDQIERFVLPLASGARRECYAITEAEAGSDPSSIRTTARRDGDHYVIDGEKWFVTSANKADFFILEAVAGSDAAAGPHALFFVDIDAPGVTMIDDPPFSHSFAHRHPTYRFDRVRVPVANRIGGEGEGMGYTRSWFRHERLMIAARCCGAAGRLIGEGLAFAHGRIVSGRPIADQQLIQAMLADSLAELWGARLMTYEAAAMHDRGEDVALLHAHCSLAKLTASEMANRVADRIVQVFGGRGYMRTNVAERFLRELRVDRIWEGTSEIQRLIIARSLLKRGVEGLIG
jgi:acyl-CoA dehydrogenase